MFLESSGVAERLTNNLATSVLEIGFGLGLNCLLSADLAEQHRTMLQYTSVEHDLIHPENFTKLHYENVLAHPSLSSELAALLPGNSQPVLSASLGSFTSLELHLCDATTLKPSESPQFHAIYLDAFSPDQNPECWEIGFLARLRDQLLPGGRIATYCAKGQFRRDLDQLGLRVTRLPGPPGKREILVAEKGGTALKRHTD